MTDYTAGIETQALTSTWHSTASPRVAAEDWSGYDTALLEGLRNGDDWAYEALIQRYQHPVHNLVYRLLADPGDAADVVQDVFLKVFRNIGSFRGQSSLKTWIYRIAVNQAHNQRRWFGRKRGHEIGLDEETGDGRTVEQLLPDGGPSPFEMASGQEMADRIEEALGRLKQPYREAVVLRDVEGLSYDEIAAVLDLPAGTVKSRIVRGREAMRGFLAGALTSAGETTMVSTGSSRV